ncbi:MAG: hypothetical protein WDN00_14965 [Limisphaerales bacterium]
MLTDAGRTLAKECKQRHETVAAFLRTLGISEKVADWTPKALNITSARKPLRRLKNF